MKKMIYAAIGVMMLGLCGFAVVFVLNFGRPIAQEELQLNVSNVEFGLPELFEPDEAASGDASGTATAAQTPVITPYTQIIYEYYEEEMGFFSATQAPADILLGKTAEDVAAFFADWNVISFDEDTVHLRQSTDIQRRNYIIGVVDGFIAVFYDNGSFVKELTNRPVAALAEEEQERLIEGIKVRGNDELMRALEDFSS